MVSIYGLPSFLAASPFLNCNYNHDHDHTMQFGTTSSNPSSAMDQSQSRAQAPRSDSPSSPLSVLSRSPSLPSSPPDAVDPSNRYPSPSTSSLSSPPVSSGAVSPIKLEMPDSIKVSTDNVPGSQSATEPPRKRRKIASDPKERTTEYLDLDHVKTSGAFDDQSARNLDRLVDVFRKRKRVVVIAGAGISVSAGIPDFRSKNGLFATLSGQMKMKGSGKDLFDASVYKDDAATERFHKMLCQMDAQVKAAKPTTFHHMLASLASEDRLMRLYSQNVDCIDTNMAPLASNVPLDVKGPWPKTIQLHGSVGHMSCSKCGQVTPMRSELFVSHEAPLCQSCKELDEVRTAHAGKRSHGIGRLRPRMVLYNEFNPDGDAIGKVSSADLKKVPDAVIVVGTSLQIPGVRRLVKELTQATRSKRGGFTAWINVDSGPQHNDFKDCWDLVVRGKADDVAHFVQLPQWDAPAADSSALLSKEDDELRQAWLRRDTLEVVFGSHVNKVQGIPTPSSSPKMPPSLPSNNNDNASDNKLAKTKQSKLSFGGARTALPDICSDNSATAANKRRKREPAKKPAKKPVKGVKKPAQPPKNSVTQAFRTVKKQTIAESVEDKKPSIEPVKTEESPAAFVRKTSELPPLRPNQPSSKDSTTYTPKEGLSSELSEVPPSSRHQKPATPPRTKLPSPRRSSPCICASTKDSKGSIVTAAPQQPSTPPMHRRTSSVNTISPTSVPRGMEALMH